MKKILTPAQDFLNQMIFRLKSATPKFFRILRRFCLTLTAVCAGLALMPLNEDNLKLIGIVGGAAGTVGAFIASLAVDWKYHETEIIPVEPEPPVV